MFAHSNTASSRVVLRTRSQRQRQKCCSARKLSNGRRSNAFSQVKRILLHQQYQQQQQQQLKRKGVQQQQQQRVPLATLSPLNVLTPLVTSTSTVEAAHQPTSPNHRLPRPPVCAGSSREIDIACLEASYPELRGVTPGYIRDRLLPVSSTQMLAGLSSTYAQASSSSSSSSLPREMEIRTTNAIASSSSSSSSIPPTHMLAVYAPTSATTPTLKRKVTLFPTHHLVLAAHCSNLPSQPFLASSSSSSTTTSIPVIPLCLPSPIAFPILQSYLYTRCRSTLLSTLLSPLSAASCDESSGVARARSAALVHGVWRDACALGVVDESLWDVLDVAWDSLVRGGATTTATTAAL